MTEKETFNNDILQSTDAQVWAKEFIRLFGDRLEDIDEDLMITWFANISTNTEINLTCKEAIDLSIAKASSQKFVRSHPIEVLGYREIDLAIQKLQEAQMWYTRGRAIQEGKFNPADLDKENGN